MRVLLHNIGTALTGDLNSPVADIDAIAIADGVIEGLGSGAGEPDVVIDCQGMTVAPGLVDTHLHPTLGDYAPKVQSVGYLARMLHGGVTRVMSAGEVHIPGRTDASTAVSIAAAAHRSFASHQPGGMKVHGGGLLLEHDTEAEHIDRAHEAGVRIVGEVGVGSLKEPGRASELVAHARSLGMTVHMHCGPTSDRGPGGDAHPYFSGDDVMTVMPTIASHANSFASLSDDDIDMICADDGPRHVEIVQAGGARAMLEAVARLADRQALDRLLIGTDTPTGYGVATLGILKTLSDICSLGDVAPEVAWAIASGQGAAAFGLDANRIAVGLAADLVVVDAPLGCRRESAVEALAAGDIPGVALVMTDGEIRVRGSLSTLRARRVVAIDGATVGAT